MTVLVANGDEAKEGDLIECPNCGHTHKLEGSAGDGKKSQFLMFYDCNGEVFLGAVDGKVTLPRKGEK